MLEYDAYLFRVGTLAALTVAFGLVAYLFGAVADLDRRIRQMADPLHPEAGDEKERARCGRCGCQ